MPAPSEDSDLNLTLRSHIHSLCKEPRTPQSAGYFRAQDYLKSCLTEMGLEPQEDRFKVLGLGTCTNIFAELNPDSTAPRILLGAHYESRDCSGVGADDNASAVAVALELTKALVSANSAIPLTIVFFDMEEYFRFGSLRGSKHFAKQYKRPIERAIILDLVGGNFVPGLENSYLQFGKALLPSKANNLEFLHLPMIALEPLGSLMPRSDYHSFRKSFTFISSGTPWYYHTSFDTPEVLNFEKMANLVESLVSALSNKQLTHITDDEVSGFQVFGTKLRDLEELQGIHELLSKIKNENRSPTRWEVIRIYSTLLSTIRKCGPNLWNQTKI